MITWAMWWSCEKIVALLTINDGLGKVNLRNKECHGMKMASPASSCPARTSSCTPCKAFAS